jgi:hypothetical protein
MAGHVRVGRRYMPQLAAAGVLHLGDWIRDDLPDLLWPALLLAHRGTQEAQGFVLWQQAVQSDLRGEVDTKELGECLDGRLTGLERLVRSYPAAEPIVKLQAERLDLLPQPVADVLSSYPERPAAWLVDGDLRAPRRDDIVFVATALTEAIRDGHREAVIKCLSIWSAVQAGTFRSDPETIELLKPYPNDLASLSRADSVVRASWGATKSALLHKDSSRFDESICWAKVFWGVNSMTTACVRRSDIDAPADEATKTGHEAADGIHESPTNGEHLQQLAMDLVASYIEALETAPSRLYDQERQEVHSGLVARAGREVIAVLGCSDLWCVEHGSHVTRVIVEVRIYLQWMATQDSAIYRQFQDYGSGKAKLYARILDEVPDEARIHGFNDAVEELERLGHNDHVIDYRVVDTGDSFGGKSLRAMAEECGLLDLYRHAYYLASGVTHSEWWSVETHAMERCLNVLHRGHLIPSMSLNSASNVALAQSWVDLLYALIRVSLQVLDTDPVAVSGAFAWLEEEGSTPTA